MTQFKTKKIKTHSNKEHPKTGTNSVSQKGKNKSLSSYKKITRRIAGGILVVALLIFGIQIGLQALGSIQISKNDEYKLFNPISINFGAKKETGPKGTKNILLAGIGGAGHSGNDLTDSLMLASINFDTKSITILSIPRDLYVAYSRSTAGRINALYNIGKRQGEGINLLAKKVSQITNQSIDHYAVIDFHGFKNIINTLDGITVDVPKTIRDTAYPTYNYGYTTFYIEKGRQTLDGETALRYARSRHSTSDYDRSARQQLILRAIKEKAMTLGILVQPQKITEIFNSLQNNINTDLTIGEVTDMALAFRDIDKKNIHLYTLNSSCAYSKCSVGAYLYNPHRSHFGGAAAIIPEKASPSRLSTYDDINTFAGLIFRYPTITKEPKWIKIIYPKSQKSKAILIRKGLEQLGFNIDHKNALASTGATEDTTMIKVYTETNGSGTTLDENNTTVKSLKFIEPDLPIEYIETNSGAKIEIIIGKDIKKYFSFAKAIRYYINDISPKTSTGDTKGSGSTKSKSTTTKPSVSSGEARSSQSRKNLIEGSF